MSTQELLSKSDGPPTTRRAPLQPPITTLTSTGVQVLKAKLDALCYELDVEFPERLREARSFGDGGYDDCLQIKEEEALVIQRVARLQDLLDSSTVSDGEPGEAGTVTVGCQVEVEDRDSGAVSEYWLVGGFEDAAAGVSVDSPVGRAVLGRRAGDEVEVDLPRGRVLRLLIVASKPG